MDECQLPLAGPYHTTFKMQGPGPFGGTTERPRAELTAPPHTGSTHVPSLGELRPIRAFHEGPRQRDEFTPREGRGVLAASASRAVVSYAGAHGLSTPRAVPCRGVQGCVAGDVRPDGACMVPSVGSAPRPHPARCYQAGSSLGAETPDKHLLTSQDCPAPQRPQV